MKCLFSIIIVAYLFVGLLVLCSLVVFCLQMYIYLLLCGSFEMKMRHSSQYQIEAVAKEAQQLPY